ncbi:MAG: hypothetical protein HQL50_01590 [Magnetococcales bacterium]|nr:hypothetical protein [Magnetococcales bacterium]
MIGLLGYVWSRTTRKIKSQHEERSDSKLSNDPLQDSAEVSYYHSLSEEVERDDGDETGSQPYDHEKRPFLICHETPWAITNQGESVGRYKNASIPSWIETSDGRQGDYHGIYPLHPPSACIGYEFPFKKEMVIAPGLVYKMRDS